MRSRLFLETLLVYIVIVAPAAAFAQDINKELVDLARELDDLKAEMDPLKALMQGAVIAFDRSEKDGACPKGWQKFDAAAGRFIVGAGITTDQSLTDHPALKDDPNSAIGGAETSILTSDNIPEHDHLLGMDTAQNQFLKEQGSSAMPSLIIEAKTFAGRTMVSGGPTMQTVRGDRSAAPLGNMPPFVALYFCKKQ